MAGWLDDPENGEIDADARDEVIDLEFADIDECDCAETLHRWYYNSIELADDVVAQIETNKITEARDCQWVRRASGVLVGLKKKIKRIERRCAAAAIDLPDTRDLRQREQITKLSQDILEARAFERGLILSWMRDTHGATVEHVAVAIEAKEHFARRRARMEQAA